MRQSCLKSHIPSGVSAGTMRTFFTLLRVFYESTKNICNRYRVELYRMPDHIGWNRGRNLLLSQVNTEYTVWLDDDFLFTESTDLSVFLDFMENNPYYDLVAGEIDNKENTSNTLGALVKKLK